jgi:LAO/AO transport system kinase
VVLTPGMGDDIQTFKAGVMEIADLFVINKADLPGAERVEQELTAMLSIAIPAGAPRPQIVKTTASTGEGAAELREALERYFDETRGTSGLARKSRQMRARLLHLLRQRLFEQVAGPEIRNGLMDRLVDDVLERRSDPYSIVDRIIRESGFGSQ